MTESEWLQSWRYRRMYDIVRDRVTTRQTRLFMVACCRLKEAEFFDARIERALQTAERCADDPQVEAVATTIWDEMVTSPRPKPPLAGLGAEVARAIKDVHELLEWLRHDDAPFSRIRYEKPEHAISHAVFMSLRDHPREIFTGGAGNAAEYCAELIESAESLRLGGKPVDMYEDNDQDAQTEIRLAIADLLREIVGNPFRTVAVAPEWLSWKGGTIPKIAQVIYDERRFQESCILADALEEAGCRNSEILTHCRSEKPHVRGCWVLDLLLGKNDLPPSDVRARSS